jgi:restriction system protein
MIPPQAELEIPLLEALRDLGGEASPKKIYPLVTARFPQLTQEDLTVTLKHGERKWLNRIQWARQALITVGDMASPQRGGWAITEQGRKRLASEGRDEPEPTKRVSSASASLVDLYETYELQFRSKLLDRLYELSPTQFEHFARHLLTAYGFVQVTVTQRAKDGGIDGHGMLKVGIARMAVAFQCKRWEGNVSRPEVDKFRGAIQGEFEQGLFFTTSDFTKRGDGSLDQEGCRACHSSQRRKHH